MFLWANKIESTSTWFGMFLETNADLGIGGESLPTVDTMAFNWLGAYPSNRSPDVTGLTLGGRAANQNVPSDSSASCPRIPSTSRGTARKEETRED